jgi:hypothetical protein
MVQDRVHQRRAIKCVQECHKLDQDLYRVTVAHTIREDLRDMLAHRTDRVNNLMILNTILLSLGMDFM